MLYELLTQTAFSSLRRLLINRLAYQLSAHTRFLHKTIQKAKIRKIMIFHNVFTRSVPFIQGIPVKLFLLGKS